MKKLFISVLLCCTVLHGHCWGFYAHRMINYYAVFLLPPSLIAFYKPHLAYLSEHAVDPDKRRYAVKGEAVKHYIDIDLYGQHPFDSLPRMYSKAVEKYSEDTVLSRGIVPWHVVRMKQRLTNAFIDKNIPLILKYSAEIGHYIADAHVPLHTSHNHNGQYTNQHGIHGLWESSIPELLAEKSFDFFIGKAAYIPQPDVFIWNRVLESAAATDSVLLFEKKLSGDFSGAGRFNYEIRNGKTVRQFSATYSRKYNDLMNGMVERRMRLAIFSVASFWLTAWTDAGQPELFTNRMDAHDYAPLDSLHFRWKQDTDYSCD